MKELLLHVGMHKTGSTSIQKTLNGFSLNGIKYANLGEFNHSIPMYTAFSEDPYNYHVHLNQGRTSGEIDRLRDEVLDSLRVQIAADDYRRLIISGEDISLFSKEAVERFVDFVTPYVDSVTVIAYVREPIGFSSSLFQQNVGGGSRGYSIPTPDYRMRFEKFLDAFGREKVIFRNFAKGALLNRSVVQDFAAQARIPHDSYSEKRANVSLPEEAVKLLHLFNRRGSLSVGEARLFRARQLMIQVLSDMFTTRFTLPRGICAAHLDYDDLEWMERVSGFDLTPSIDRDECVEWQSITDYLESIPVQAFVPLRKYLSDRGSLVKKNDDAVTLLNKLYYLFLLGRPVEESDAFMIRDIALKLERHPDFKLEDARALMHIAHKIHPFGPFIKQKLEKYDRKLSSLQNERSEPVDHSGSGDGQGSHQPQ